MYSLVAEPCAVQRGPRPAVGVTESVTPAVWESECCLVSAPGAQQLAEAPTGAAAKVDLFERYRPPLVTRRLRGEVEE